ncbi:MAG TPA: methyltransferase [Polyangiales bacterium]|nr:methyltransferase [Polyangiales bacterium]
MSREMPVAEPTYPVPPAQEIKPQVRAVSLPTRVNIALAFFLSGVAALGFETLWFRQASLAFGNSVWASSIVLSGFMAGMAGGYGVGGRIGKTTQNPLRLFALLEAIVGISGCVLVYVLPELPTLLGKLSASLEGQLVLLNTLRLVVAFVLLLLPSAAMGMSLPVLVAGLSTGAGDKAFGRVLGTLYGINTLGAVIGSCIMELWLIHVLGVHQSAFAAAACNMIAGALALVAAQTYTPREATRAPAAESGDGSAFPWLFGAFISGFAVLALEVIWLRFLTLFLSDTDLAFTWVLACVLGGIAIGGVIAAVWASFHKSFANLAYCVVYLAIAATVFSYRAQTASISRELNLGQSMLSFAAPLVLPTAILSGVLFTVLGAGLRRVIQDDARAAGRLALWNTLGGMAGSLFAGFVLLPNLGVERSLFFIVLCYAISGGLLAFRAPGKASERWVWSGAALVALLLFPHGNLHPIFVRASIGRWMRPGDKLVKVVETSNGTYSHVVHNYRGKPLFDQLATNAYSMTVNDFAARRYMDQYVFLPRALHPKLERALVIGYGIGNTVRALLNDTTIKHVDVVDVSREALALSRNMHARFASSPLDDPRVHVHIEDGRHFLAGHSDKYDLITGEPPPPIIAGVVNLYTQEFFESARKHLAPGGFMTYWLPLMNLSAPSARAVIGAFCNAYDDCSLWNGSVRNFMLMGTNKAPPMESADHFRAQWRDPKVLPELEAVGFEVPEQLTATYIADGKELRHFTIGMPPLTDDRPKRLTIAGSYQTREALIWQWRDTLKARIRFSNSEWVKNTFPTMVRVSTGRQFESQRLVNDLMFPEPTGARQTTVLGQVLRGTPLRLPPLLMLNSDPDVQAIVAKLTPQERSQPEWAVDVAANYLADRDLRLAWKALQHAPERAMPLEGLVKAVEDWMADGNIRRRRLGAE